MRFRTVREEDWGLLAKCANAAFVPSPRQSAFTMRMDGLQIRPAEWTRAQAAFTADRCAGYIIGVGNPEQPKTPCKIREMAVAPGFRRQGLGSRLLRGMLSSLRRDYQPSMVFLHMEEGNTAARKLYVKAGLKEDMAATAALRQNMVDDEYCSDRRVLCVMKKGYRYR